MEEIPLEEHARAARAPVDEDLGEKSCQFKGIRKRKWGSWVSEIRMPRSREKLWLGSYTTAEQAARAFDAAVYCLRGPNSISNFPDSVPSIPSASSLSRNQIQLAAARYATSLDQLPSISTSAHNDIENDNANNNNKATEDSVSPSRSASVQETVPLNDSRHQQEQDLVLWESLLAESDDYLTQNVERLPSIDEASALNLLPSWEEEEINNCLQITDLWNFGDV